MPLKDTDKEFFQIIKRNVFNDTHNDLSLEDQIKFINGLQSKIKVWSNRVKRLNREKIVNFSFVINYRLYFKNVENSDVRSLFLKPERV